eukprot:55790-Prymnesium_polylepis.1
MAAGGGQGHRSRSGPLGIARDRSSARDRSGPLGTTRDRSGPLGTTRDRSGPLASLGMKTAQRKRLRTIKPLDTVRGATEPLKLPAAVRETTWCSELGACEWYGWMHPQPLDNPVMTKLLGVPPDAGSLLRLPLLLDGDTLCDSQIVPVKTR